MDKYDSAKFFDLLTDESVNRNVLTWLKSWDEIVFPSKERVSLRLPDSVLNQPGAAFLRGLTIRKYDPVTKQAVTTTADQEFSHHNRMLLALHGPPGSGKSTMARVLARLCGYRPQIVNASDVRSPSALIGAIRTAVSCDSHFSEVQKPTCLIIDEVDGALQGNLSHTGFNTVTTYLSKCMALRKGETKSKDEAGRRNTVVELKRPIIFICNDLYSRPLKTLREMTLNVKIQQSDPQRLISRMRQICRLENLPQDDQMMQQIAAANHYDARQTITQLQFFLRH